MYLTNIEISTIKDGLRFIKAQILSLYNVRDIPQYGPPGLDSAPVGGALAFSAPTVAKGRDVILGYQNVNQIALPGETILYSQNPRGQYQATATMRVDGTIELLGIGDNLVRYTALDTALQAEVAQINANNALIATAIATLAAFHALPPPYVPIPVTVVTTAAKVDKIKTTAI